MQRIVGQPSQRNEEMGYHPRGTILHAVCVSKAGYSFRGGSALHSNSGSLKDAVTTEARVSAQGTEEGRSGPRLYKEHQAMDPPQPPHRQLDVPRFHRRPIRRTRECQDDGQWDAFTARQRGRRLIAPAGAKSSAQPANVTQPCALRSRARKGKSADRQIVASRLPRRKPHTL